MKKRKRKRKIKNKKKRKNKRRRKRKKEKEKEHKIIQINKNLCKSNRINGITQNNKKTPLNKQRKSQKITTFNENLLE